MEAPFFRSNFPLGLAKRGGCHHLWQKSVLEGACLCLHNSSERLKKDIGLQGTSLGNLLWNEEVTPYLDSSARYILAQVSTRPIHFPVGIPVGS